MTFVVHTDGGARGNPGPAAIGIVIEEITGGRPPAVGNTKTIREIKKRIGETTNNVAEYVAVLEALKELKSQSPAPPTGRSKLNAEGNSDIQFYVDSNLVVQQLNGIFKVKNPKLRELLLHIRVLEREIGREVRYAFIPREQNRRADLLVNRSLDKR